MHSLTEAGAQVDATDAPWFRPKPKSLTPEGNGFQPGDSGGSLGGQGCGRSMPDVLTMAAFFGPDFGGSQPGPPPRSRGASTQEIE